MKINVIAFLIFSFIFLTACDYFDDRLVINNESDNNIYVAFSKDTLLYFNNNFIMPDYFIKGHSKKKIIEPGSKNAWEFFLEKSLDKQLHIFILFEDTLKKYEASKINKMKKYDRRIDVDLRELEAKNWEIIYK